MSFTVGWWKKQLLTYRLHGESWREKSDRTPGGT